VTKQDITRLIEEAYKITGKYQPGECCTSGSVGAALLTKDGNIYTGVSVDCSCGIGFCAEHSAVAEMLKHHESEINLLVAINYNQEILPPCGRCRELIYQVNPLNQNASIILSNDKVILLKELLSCRWQDI
jgi:cytidine deaminase